MSEETRLTEHEKQHLNALKLFLERTSDLKVLESGKVLDALSPEEVRAILGLYDRALKNPQLGTRALTIYLLGFLLKLPPVVCKKCSRFTANAKTRQFRCGTSIPNARSGPRPTLFRCVP